MLLDLWRDVDIPPLWLGLCLALVWKLGQVMPMAFPFEPIIGAALILIGLVLMGAALIQMLLHRTTFIPRRDPHALVTGGVFSLSRNPIYLGNALVLAGAALWWNAPYALALVPVFMWFLTWRYIRGEEATIAAHFGEEYAAYRSRVRRWI